MFPLLAALLCVVGDSAAFPHIVIKGDTVAQLAERIYGRVELERVVVAANGLDGRAGSTIVPGMRLEIPAVSYHRVIPGDSWQSLAGQLLGSRKRGVVLARVNGSEPWIQPTIGKEIVIPYNLRYVASRGDTTQTVAYRFLGRRDQAWIVSTYNGLKRARLRQGEVILVPLTDLTLTESGKREALVAGALIRSQAAGQAREAQRVAEREIPLLVTDVRRGRYVRAVGRGAGLLARGSLSQPQLAAIHRQLTEAYVALGAMGLAATACTKWREAEPDAALDRLLLSPKILQACIGDTKTSSGISPAIIAPQPSGKAGVP